MQNQPNILNQQNVFPSVQQTAFPTQPQPNTQAQTQIHQQIQKNPVTPQMKIQNVASGNFIYSKIKLYQNQLFKEMKKNLELKKQKIKKFSNSSTTEFPVQ
jgi:hypothetical protein